MSHADQTGAGSPPAFVILTCAFRYDLVLRILQAADQQSAGYANDSIVDLKHIVKEARAEVAAISCSEPGKIRLLMRLDQALKLKERLDNFKQAWVHSQVNCLTMDTTFGDSYHGYVRIDHQTGGIMVIPDTQTPFKAIVP